MRTRTAFLLAAVFSTPALAQPLSTAFTYQGRLDDNGSPANGAYDFRFTLYDAASGGNQVGLPQCVDNVQVTNGLFTAQVDFLGAYTGQQRHLEIWARQDSGQPCSNTLGYTILPLRQSLTTTPFAAFSLNAGNLGGQPASFYTDAASLSSGTLADARLSPNIPRLNAFNTFTNHNRFNGFVGVNRDAAVTGADVLALQNPPGLGGYTGMYIVSDDAVDGLPFYGYVAGNTAAWTYLDTAGNWRLFMPSGDALIVRNNGFLGVGVPVPTSRLHVAGSAAADDFTFNAPQAGYYAVSQSAFVSRDSTPVNSTVSQGGAWPTQPSSVGLCAPVNLPHGATVTRIRFHYYDNDAAKDLAFSFSRHHPLGAFATLASGATSGSSPDFQSIDLTNLNITIDNSTFTYQITVFPSSPWSDFNMTVRGAHIEYTLPRPAR